MTNFYKNIDPRVRIVRKTADQTVNNSVVLVNDDDLKLAVAANEVWAFEIFILQNSGAAPDIKYVGVGPAGSTVFMKLTQNSSAVVGISNLGLGRAADAHVELTGIIINGATPGDLQLQWAQNLADASDTDVLENSCLIAHRII